MIKIVVALVVITSFFFFLRTTDFTETKLALQKIGTGFIWIIVSTLTAYLLGTIGWQYCLTDSRHRIPLGQLFMVRHVCETVSLFNPASVVGGDLLKVMLLKPFQVEEQTVINSVLISRILMVASQVLLLIIALCWMIIALPAGVSPIPSHYLALVLAVVFIVLAICCYLLFFQKKERKKEIAGQLRKAASFTSRVAGTLQNISGFYRHHPHAFAMSFLYFTLHWITGSLEFYIILKFMGYDLTAMHGLLLDMGVIVFKSAGAFIPGQFGVEELGNKMMLALIGIGGTSVWLSVSVLRRARQLFWILIGAIFYFFAIRRRALIV